MIIICERFGWTFDYYRSMDPDDMDRLHIYLETESVETRKKQKEQERKSKQK